MRHDVSRATGFAGIGPSGHPRGDRRIFEDVCEALTRDGELDARYLRVSVRDRLVVLDGRVATRDDKYLAEELAEAVRGVTGVDNRLRIGARRDPSAFAPIRESGVFGQLIHEHRIIAALFDIVLGTPATEPDDRLAAFGLLAKELLAHAHAEDDVVYDALGGSFELGDRIADARREHAEVERLVRELEQLGDANEHWMNRVKALEQAVERHVRIEEQSIIPRAHQVIDDTRAAELLDTYRQRRALHDDRIAVDTTATARGSRRRGGEAAPDPAASKPEAHRSDAHTRARK
jgi:hemerythrin superfamily protein